MNDCQFFKDDVEDISTTTLTNGFLKVNRLRLKFRLFQGGWSLPITRELVLRGATVALLVYDPLKDSVLLIEQMRVGALRDEVSPWQLELIAGMVELGEDEQAVALRECEEESGLQINTAELLFRYYNSPGLTDETTSLFYAEASFSQTQGIHGLAYEGENIRTRVVSRKSALAQCHAGVIKNAHVILALQWLELSLMRDKKAALTK